MIMNDAVMRNFVPKNPNPTMEEFAARSQVMNAIPVPWVEPIDASNAVA